jgi:ABC-2 type transport system ATP-binding protein
MNPVETEPVDDRSPVVEIQDLWRWYTGFWGRKATALKGVTFSVSAGEVVGLLGPNGAGKTTTLKILLGMLRPSRGSVRIFGRAVSDPEARNRLGFLSEQPYFYDYLSAREFLDLCGVLCGMPGAVRRRRAHELLERVGLQASADLRLRKYSKGMLQRLGLAQALLHSPPLVILDEPMSGLDPLGRSLVRDVILNLKQDGVTVLFSSHVLPDIETLCDRVVIIASGAVVAQGTVTDLTAEADPDFEVVAQDLDPRICDGIENAAVSIRQAGRRTIIRAADRAAMNRIVGTLLSSGAELIGVSPRRSPLETHFLNALAGTDSPMNDGGTESQRARGDERSAAASRASGAPSASQSASGAAGAGRSAGGAPDDELRTGTDS